ncbi:MAG: family 20 glycosylhydrolase, partial [Ginsengibacter sp.]
MKKGILFSALMLLSLFSFCQTGKVDSSLLPVPVSVNQRSGNFVLNNNTTIEIHSTDASAKRVAKFLADKLKITGFSIPVSTFSTAGNSIKFSLVSDASLGDEGYKLDVAPGAISVTANKPAGLFYGVQTLIQLMPKEIESDSIVKETVWTIPACSITDYPRFKWRGLMFDVARHFFTKEEVKRYIDEMVKYKFNLLHLHLTDDEGWRIEIKSLPRLTEVGAWNVKRVGYFGTFQPPAPDEPRTYG